MLFPLRMNNFQRIVFFFVKVFNFLWISINFPSLSGLFPLPTFYNPLTCVTNFTYLPVFFFSTTLQCPSPINVKQDPHRCSPQRHIQPPTGVAVNPRALKKEKSRPRGRKKKSPNTCKCHAIHDSLAVTRCVKSCTESYPGENLTSKGGRGEKNCVRQKAEKVRNNVTLFTEVTFFLVVFLFQGQQWRCAAAEGVIISKIYDQSNVDVVVLPVGSFPEGYGEI